IMLRQTKLPLAALH
ncbi:hypothetical protein L195_g062836, partial [Trifolium pratense]